MTSTEFAARYRLLKNVATRGARSFLAQQVELGRMVMVHYLDSETPQQRAATLARLGKLQPPARGKLLEIADVDGSPVAVTLFLSSFVDFATWLDSVSDPLTSPPVAPAAPRFAEPPAASSAAAPAGDFTRMFGKLDDPSFVLSATAEPMATGDEPDSPTLIMEPVTPPQPRKAEPAPLPPPPMPAAPPPPSNEGGFTAIFGRIDAPPPAAPIASSPVEPSFSFAPPPAAPIDNYSQSSPPAAAPGEFTQLFQKISPTPGLGTADSAAPIAFPFPINTASPSPPVPPPTPSFRSSDMPRPFESTPAADLAPPPLATPFLNPSAPPPPLGAPAAPPPSLSSLGAIGPFGTSPPPLAPPMPHFADAAPPNVDVPTPSAAAPTPMWGAAAPPSLGAPFDGGVQSEYTRILGRVAVPPPPATIAPLPTAPAAAPAAEQKPKKSLVPLWIGLNVVVLLTIAIVAYFMLRRG